jgi:hypothetical protein
MNSDIKLFIITPKVYNKKIGPKSIKYVNITYFSMIGTINQDNIDDLEKLALL